MTTVVDELQKLLAGPANLTTDEAVAVAMAIALLKAQSAQPSQADMEYTISLQRAIETHCDNKTVPESVSTRCPHHAKMLNDKLGQPSQAGEPTTSPMTAERAAYFMRRFKHEEKLLGPNEQAAVDYVIALLEKPSQAGELSDLEILRHWARRDKCLHGRNAVIWFARAVIRAEPSTKEDL